MAGGTLALSGLVHWTAAVVFVAVAWGLRRRSVPADAAPAHQAFVLWWGCLGVYMAVQGGFALAAAADRLPPFVVYQASRVLLIPALCLGAWGLAYHVTYLYTGARRAAWPLGAFYAAVCALFFYAVWTMGATAFHVGAWLVEAEGSDDTWPFRAVYFGVGVPPILATLLYLSLVFRLEDPMQRYRVVLVGAGILAWVGGGLAARLRAGEPVIFTTLVLFGLGAAGAVWWAYHPPAWVVRRLDPAARAQAAAKGRGRQGFQERMQNLV